MAIGSLNPLLQFLRDHQRTELESGGTGEPGRLQRYQVFRDIRQKHSNPSSRPRSQTRQGTSEAAGPVGELPIANGSAEKCARRALGKTLGSRFQQGADTYVRVGQR